MKECTEELFLKDVADHKMTILLDNGLHRCLRFAREGENSWWNWFTITTWPGYLSINGDMGCYVFTRIEDMFEFFRSPYPDKLGINLGYWMEKCVSQDRHIGCEAYDEDKFKKIVKEHFDDFWSEFPKKLFKQEREACWEDLKFDVLSAECEFEAHRSASDFQYEFDDVGAKSRFELTDFWEHNLKSYTYQYQWCCYAIAWAIQQYDLAKKVQ